ncbi:MAG: hypothetical protein WA900_06755 [Casimicrobiaceae bacterium]
MGFKIEELMDRSLREPSAKERADQARYSWSKPDLRVFTPSGRLKLTVLSENQYSPYFSISDGASVLDTRISDIVERVWTRAAEANVQLEMRDEDRRRWEEHAARRREREQIRAAELGRLKEVEEDAQRWHRAQVLRSYVHAMNQPRDGAAVPREKVGAAWISNAADWLDPLVSKPWPDVDIDG